jgi:4-diphosphocytidyl-2-C-methyl-D-erythritol kinase
MQFVNAKINIGLQIVRRREDGYHDLQTLFYPVGIESGTAENPVRFCDLIEAVATERAGEVRLTTEGRAVDCPTEKNLVYRAAKRYLEARALPYGANILLHKNLPDGAGMGGGSADATFTLKEMDRLAVAAGYDPMDAEEMAAIALSLGADCPFFLINRPAYAEGVGERLQELPLNLDKYWFAIVKPALYISTREAFAGITPRAAEFSLLDLPRIPISEWRLHVKNDFEESLFPNHAALRDTKAALYDHGAEYSQMTGSGSALFGIFAHRDDAEQACLEIGKSSTIESTYLLKG